MIVSPYMLPGAQPEPYVRRHIRRPRWTKPHLNEHLQYLGEHLVAASSKIAMIDKLLVDILGKGERALVFSVSSATLMARSIGGLQLPDVPFQQFTR